MTTSAVKYEYEIALHCLAEDAFCFNAAGEEDIVQCLRIRADKNREHLVSVSDVVDKLVNDGWTIATSAWEHDSVHPHLLCWKDEAPFSSEASLREHLQMLAIATDVAFIEIVQIEVDDEDEHAEDADEDDEEDDAADDTEDDDPDGLFAPKRQLYLVRWQNLSAALVMAYDENELLDILDEEADTTACSWWEYDGSLFVDFTLPIEWKHIKQVDGHASDDYEDWNSENIRITKMPDDTLDVTEFQMRLAGCDTAWATKEKIFELAFPQLHQVFFKDSYDGDEPPAEKVANAAREESARTMREHRRIKQATEQRAGAGDREAAIALMMGTSVESVQSMNANGVPPALAAEQPLPPLAPPSKETGN